MQEIVAHIVQSFDLDVVFSSVQGFLGSGYVCIVVAVVIAHSIISKLMKLLAFGCIAMLVWFVCRAGLADPIFAALGLG